MEYDETRLETNYGDTGAAASEAEVRVASADPRIGRGRRRTIASSSAAQSYIPKICHHDVGIMKP